MVKTKGSGDPRTPYSHTKNTLVARLKPLKGYHSQQERKNHALTQCDPGHSTTMTSIPLQRWGNGNCATCPPLYANLGARTAHPRRHKRAQNEAWTQNVAPANGEVKRLTTITSLCHRGNCSHRIRRKTAAPEATFFVFLFRLSPLHLFITNVT
jgi:hypothetical protein